MTAFGTRVTRSDFHEDTQRYFKGKRVVVTGGGGFVGSHVVEQLLALEALPIVPVRTRGHFLDALRDKIDIRPCDLNDLAQTREAFRGGEIVLNLAANVGGLDYNAKHPASIFQSNLQVFFNSIQVASEIKVQRFLVTSSACVYPRVCSVVPTPESESLFGEPEPTNAGYCWSKRMEEFLAQQYANEFALPVAITRPYNAFGPRDRFTPGLSHVIPSLIHRAFTTEDGVLKVWGNGTQTRSFLYVDDFARGTIEIAARYGSSEPLNIGSAEEVAIRDVAEIVAREASKIRKMTITPAFDTSGLTGQPRRSCDTTKISNALGFQTEVGLEEGIRRTIDWYVHEHHSVPSRPQ